MARAEASDVLSGLSIAAGPAASSARSSQTRRGSGRRAAPDSAGPGPEGTLQLARIRIAGQEVLVSDSFVEHAFDFTPSFSFFVAVADRGEFDRLADHLSGGGAWLMPPDDYGFSERFGWCNDRFGVSWQISLG